MPDAPLIVRRDGAIFPSAVLRTQDEWGLITADLVSPPFRLLPTGPAASSVVEQGVDLKRTKTVCTPANLFHGLPEADNWSAQTRRSLARLLACYLVAEDPQRRLDAREVCTLAHQVSLVRHVLDNAHLRRVLIADEVGLGKTVEVGLILKELLEKSPQLRVLYLAPARLVPNVRREFDNLKLSFRQWSSLDADARLTDNRVIASIHRAVHPRHVKAITEGQAWDIVIVDECHHLSDWAQGGGDPKEKFKLVRDLAQRQTLNSRVILLSGTPHQGHGSRFENLIGLLRSKSEQIENLTGRVIYRTKDDVHDWNGNLLFPRRHVKEPIVVDLGPDYKAWIAHIHDFFRPTGFDNDKQSSRRRAAGWRCAQALQWAASSPQAGVGYLVRQAIRAGWKLTDDTFRQCVASLRPYRGGSPTESIDELIERICKEVGRQVEDEDLEDIELDFTVDFGEETAELRTLLKEGLAILGQSTDAKWKIITTRILDLVGSEKVVLFAQPIETVTAFATFLERTTGNRPALIIGGQTDAERSAEIESFRRPDGAQFLVSSRAGGEGINLQVSRRLVHIDVPWNPMDMEQRVGRVHRFGSRKTIIVDTLVVKDSREEHAYRVARDKLRNITATMVEPERFEQVFSRVMCLVPPEELQNVLANSPAAPLTPGDQEIIAKVVREGFAAWQDFDRRFADSQKQIRAQDPGLAAWDDVALFLKSFGKWSDAEGFVKQKFAWIEGELEAVEEPTSVLTSPDGKHFACSDEGGIPVFGRGEQRADQLGLNLAAVRESLASAAFPESPTGAFYVRWSSADDATSFSTESRFMVFIFLKQSVRPDQLSGWSETALTLHTFVADALSEPKYVEGSARRKLVRGLVNSTPRVKSPPDDGLHLQLSRIEASLYEPLRRPSPDELVAGVRHAVWPIACGIIDLEK